MFGKKQQQFLFAVIKLNHGIASSTDMIKQMSENALLQNDRCNGQLFVYQSNYLDKKYSLL